MIGTDRCEAQWHGNRPGPGRHMSRALIGCGIVQPERDCSCPSVERPKYGGHAGNQCGEKEPLQPARHDGGRHIPPTMAPDAQNDETRPDARERAHVEQPSLPGRDKKIVAVIVHPRGQPGDLVGMGWADVREIGEVPDVGEEADAGEHHAMRRKPLHRGDVSYPDAMLSISRTAPRRAATISRAPGRTASIARSDIPSTKAR